MPRQVPVIYRPRFVLASVRLSDRSVLEYLFKRLIPACDLIIRCLSRLYTMFNHYSSEYWPSSEVPKVRRPLLRRQLTPPATHASIPAQVFDAVLYTKQQFHDQSVSPFFTKLPPEIRLLIYDLVFNDAPQKCLTSDGLVVRRVCSGPSWLSMMPADQYRRTSDKNLLSLPRACRRLYFETMHLLYKRSNLVFASGTNGTRLALESFLSKLPAHHMSWINTVTIEHTMVSPANFNAIHSASFVSRGHTRQSRADLLTICDQNIFATKSESSIRDWTARWAFYATHLGSIKKLVVSIETGMYNLNPTEDLCIDARWFDAPLRMPGPVTLEIVGIEDGFSFRSLFGLQSIKAEASVQLSLESQMADEPIEEVVLARANTLLRDSVIRGVSEILMVQNK